MYWKCWWVNNSVGLSDVLQLAVLAFPADINMLVRVGVTNILYCVMLPWRITYYAQLVQHVWYCFGVCIMQLMQSCSLGVCVYHAGITLTQKESYRLTAVAQDRGFPPLSRTVEVQIEVVDRANNPPVWTQSIYGPIYIKENLPVGAGVISVKARLGRYLLYHRYTHGSQFCIHPSPCDQQHLDQVPCLLL